MLPKSYVAFSLRFMLPFFHILTSWKSGFQAGFDFKGVHPSTTLIAEEIITSNESVVLLWQD